MKILKIISHLGLGEKRDFVKHRAEEEEEVGMEQGREGAERCEAQCWSLSVGVQHVCRTVITVCQFPVLSMRLLSCLLNSGRACDLICPMKSEQRWHPFAGRHFWSKCAFLYGPHCGF